MILVMPELINQIQVPPLAYYVLLELLQLLLVQLHVHYALPEQHHYLVIVSAQIVILERILQLKGVLHALNARLESMLIRKD